MTAAPAGDWVGWLIIALVALAGLVIGVAILAARWPDVRRWIGSFRRPPAQETLRLGAERDLLRSRVASLVADNTRLRGERDRYRRERDEARRALGDEQRNSVTVIQLPRLG